MSSDNELYTLSEQVYTQACMIIQLDTSVVICTCPNMACTEIMYTVMYILVFTWNIHHIHKDCAQRGIYLLK